MIKLKDSKLKIKPIPCAKLLPNVVTLIGLVIGVSSIRYALDARWEHAVYCLLIAAIIDGIDGRVARMLGASSRFGAELDSLCDLVNFGLCPAVLIYTWCMHEYDYKLISWACVMLFTICMALRLARFNTTNLEQKNGATLDQRFFIGVPAPVGAILVMIPLMVDFSFSTLIEDFNIREHTLLIGAYVVTVALLLPSRFPTISLKKIHIPPEYVAISLIVSSIIIILTVIYTWYVLPIAAILYLGSIPMCIKVKKNSSTNICKSSN